MIIATVIKCKKCDKDFIKRGTDKEDWIVCPECREKEKDDRTDNSNSARNK